MAKDFYSELGVSRTASPDEIKKAYRKLAGKYHPDKNPGDAQAEKRFKAINEAHQALSDEKRRKLYDEFGEVGLKEGFNPDMHRAYGSGGAGGFGNMGGINFEDIFGGQAGGGVGDLFGDLFRRGGRGPKARRGADQSSRVDVDFIDAIRGTTLKLTLGGSEEVSVRIPAGAQDGDRVRVKGFGQRGAGGAADGDLLLDIRVGQHPFFERKGLDLYVDLPLTLAEAYHGAKVRVPTPSGEVTLTVPEGAQSGRFARLKGRGVARKNETGDLYVRFCIKLPEARSPELEAAVQQLAEATGDIRADLKF